MDSSTPAYDQSTPRQFLDDDTTEPLMLPTLAELFDPAVIISTTYLHESTSLRIWDEDYTAHTTLPSLEELFAPQLPCRGDYDSPIIPTTQRGSPCLSTEDVPIRREVLSRQETFHGDAPDDPAKQRC